MREQFEGGSESRTARGVFTRRRVLSGVVVLGGAGTVGAYLLRPGGDEVKKGPRVRIPDESEGASSGAAPGSSGPAGSPGLPGATRGSAAASPAASATASAPNLRPNAEIQPGTVVGLFLGAAFLRQPGQSELTVVYNPLITEDAVYYAERNGTNGLVPRSAGSAVESWQPAHATGIVTNIIGFNNVATRTFDGYTIVSNLGPVATYTRALVGKTVSGASDAAALKRAGAMGYYVGFMSELDATRLKTDMTLAGATVPYPGE